MKLEMRRRYFLRCLSGIVVFGGGVQRVESSLAVSTTRRRIRFVFTFINPFGRVLEEQRFWAYLPADIPPTQRLLDVNSTTPFRLLEDKWGHRILFLEFNRVQPFSNKIVTVTADVELQPGASIGRFENRAHWLGPERFVESDHFMIQALAKDLKRNSIEESARGIYDWVRENLHYTGYLEDQRGALSALRERGGDCTEYADLVVALARAVGIPARALGGYVSEWDFSPKPQEYHNWAELYINDAWRIVDAQKEAWLPSLSAYVIFKIQRDNISNPIGEAHRYRVLGEVLVR